MLETFKRSYQSPEDGLVVTSMDRPYMYTQIWYKVSNKYALRHKLQKLKCVVFASGSKNKFQINDCKEFTKYLPESNHSFEVIAEGKIMSDNTLRMSVFSLDEAVAIIELLHAHISLILTIESFEHINCLSFVSTQEDKDNFKVIDYTQILQDIPTTCIWPNPQLLEQNNLTTIQGLEHQEKVAYMEISGDAAKYAIDTRKILIDLDKMDYEDFINIMYLYVGLSVKCLEFAYNNNIDIAEMISKDRQNAVIPPDSTVQQVDDHEPQHNKKAK